MLVNPKGKQGKTQWCFLCKGLTYCVYYSDEILDVENGLAERLLFICQKAISKDLEEMAHLCEKLNDFRGKSLKVVLEQVYAEHNNDMSIKYSLSASLGKHSSSSLSHKNLT